MGIECHGLPSEEMRDAAEATESKGVSEGEEAATTGRAGGGAS